jgi:hypothetical protein
MLARLRSASLAARVVARRVGFPGRTGGGVVHTHPSPLVADFLKTLESGVATAEGKRRPFKPTLRLRG